MNNACGDQGYQIPGLVLQLTRHVQVEDQLRQLESQHLAICVLVPSFSASVKSSMLRQSRHLSMQHIVPLICVLVLDRDEIGYFTDFGSTPVSDGINVVGTFSKVH